MLGTVRRVQRLGNLIHFIEKTNTINSDSK